MKIKRLITYCLLAGTCFLASCDNGVVTDSDQATTLLPEGMYPLTFTATQANMQVSPQTRVSDYDETGGSHKSQWTDGDKINVIIGNNPEIGTYTLNADGSIKTADQPVYWQTAIPQTVNAWYSNITDPSTVTSNTVSLADQSNGLAYVLKATAPKATFNTPAQLEFKHQLAKVRVKLEKRIYEDNLSDATVKVKGYTSCTVSNGAVTAGGTTGDITMHKATYGSDTYYEANVVPGTTLNGNAFEISLNGKTTKANLKNEITLTPGNVHTITLAIDDKELTEIKGGETINSSGYYIMTGTITQTVTLNGDGINLILKDVNVAITGQDKPAIEITGGSPVITVVGKNNVLSSGQWGGIILKNGANIEIVGTGKENSSLTVTAGDNGWDGASTVGIGASQNEACGNISISNVNLTVSGANSFNGGSAAIGTNAAIGTRKSVCGNITITDAIIDATSGSGAAAIGLGCTYHADNTLSVGDIKITGSEIVVKLKPYKGDNLDNFSYGAGIGMGIIWYGKFECGTITIDKNDDDLDAFTKEWVLEESNITKHNYKIGKGYEHTGANPQGLKFGGVKLKNKDLIDGWGKWQTSVP